jgi:queuine tRNA-ribosyltransferase
MAREILGLRLNTLHNLHFYLALMRQIRQAIEDGSLTTFRTRFREIAGMLNYDETVA